MTDVPCRVARAEDCVEEAIRRVGKRIVLGAPIGIGKPNRLVNAFYRRAVADRSIELTIFTGLSLEKPRPRSAVEARLLGPMVERIFGDYEEPEYIRAQRGEALPANVRVHEFYFPAGSMRGVAGAQRNYISSNYTFAARDMQLRGMNVMVQLVASAEVEGRPKLSLASNTDTSLDLLQVAAARRGQGGEPLLTVAEIHPQMPFMYNRAMIEPAAFDIVLDDPAGARTLFAPPNESVGVVDYAIALHTSTLLRDGGTLQIGIGSLGDAIAQATLLRHASNDAWRAMTTALGINGNLARSEGGDGPFRRGLYGCSEMFVNGFLHLIRAGVIRRRVYPDLQLQRAVNRSGCTGIPDAALLQALCEVGAVAEDPGEHEVGWLCAWGVFAPDVALREGRLWRGEASVPARLGTDAEIATVAGFALGSGLRGGIHMHGGFFLGPRDFYQALRDMPCAEAELIGMDSVRCINRIDDPPLREAQRLHARFINTAMMVTLSGAAVSDALETGEVISGVGGQYNFVAQAHEMPGARSVILLRATRGSGKSLASNIVPRYGHATVPRHLRDIVVTEYGAADLRAASDAEIAARLLEIADSRFQPQLLAAAIAAGRLPAGHVIPARARNNLPERIAGALGPWREQGVLPAFPLGTDFTAEEIALGACLTEIKALMAQPLRLGGTLLRSVFRPVRNPGADRYLARLGLEHPATPRDVLLRLLLLQKLREKGFC